MYLEQPSHQKQAPFALQPRFPLTAKRMEALFLSPSGPDSHVAPFAPTVQGDRLPDEQHAARAVPLVPVPAGAAGVRGHLRPAGRHGRSGSRRVHRPGHGCPRALRGLRGEQRALKTGSGWGVVWESEWLCFGGFF